MMAVAGAYAAVNPVDLSIAPPTEALVPAAEPVPQPVDIAKDIAPQTTSTAPALATFATPKTAPSTLLATPARETEGAVKAMAPQQTLPALDQDIQKILEDAAQDARDTLVTEDA